MISETYSDNSRKLAAIVVMAAVCGFCAFITWRLSSRLDQTLVAGVLIFMGVQLAIVAPRVAIMATLFFLPVSGDLRRIMLFYVGRANQDPLLLVGPAMLGALLFGLIYRGQLDFSSRYSHLVFWLTILMLLQVVNPMQGGLMVGLVGVMFFVVPLSWYWIGQRYGTEEFFEKFLFFGVIPVAVVASIYTLYQINFGLPAYQLHWLQESGMNKMNVGGTPRPFAFFGSAQECGMFYGAAVATLVAAGLTGRNRKLLVLVPLFLVCIVLQGGRGLIVMSLFMIAMLWALNGRAAGSWIIRSVLALVVGFSALVFALLSSSSIDVASPVAPILQHHTRGITKVGESTLGDHLKMAAYGIYMGTLDNPVGNGLGSTTIAAQDAGTSFGNMEVDFSNIFISMGVVGGVLYLVMIFKTFHRAIKLWNHTRNFRALAMFGICMFLVGHYLSGMAYSVVVVAWFTIGALDRQFLRTMPTTD